MNAPAASSASDYSTTKAARILLLYVPQSATGVDYSPKRYKDKKSLLVGNNSAAGERRVQVTTRDRLSDNADDILGQQLTQLRDLEAGWDGYNAEAPSRLAIENSERLLSYLIQNNFLPDQVMASVEGGIAMPYIRGNIHVGFECCNDGDIVAVISEGTGNPQVWLVNLEDRQDIEATVGELRAVIEK